MRLLTVWWALAASMAVGALNPDAQGRQVVPADSPSALECPDDVSGYRLRNDAFVRTRVNLLGSLDPLLQSVRPDLPQRGSVYSDEAAAAGSKAIFGALSAKEAGDARFRLTIRTTYYRDCASDSRELDIAYEVMRFQIAPPTLRFRESAEARSENPSRSANYGLGLGRLSIRPVVGYNAADKLTLGTSAAYEFESGIVKTIRAGGRASDRAETLQFSLEGSTSSWKWADMAHWTLAYDFQKRPGSGQDLQHSRGLGQFWLALPPIWNDSVVFRLGTSVDTGVQQSEVRVGSRRNTVPSSAYSSVKAFAGATGRTRRQGFAASYGLQIGSLRNGGGVDYYKHIGDIAWDFRYPLGDHRTLEVEASLLFGSLRVPGQVPVSERFFGGGDPPSFAVLENWKIRSAPLIRSIPHARLDRTAPGLGIGGEHYVSVNLTAAPTLWRKPLLPDVVGRDPDFRQALEMAKGEARTGMKPLYRANVPRTNSELQSLDSIATAAAELGDRIRELAQQRPDNYWDICEIVSDLIGPIAKSAQTDAMDLSDLFEAITGDRGAIASCREKGMTKMEIDSVFGRIQRLSSELEMAYESRPELLEATREAVSDFDLSERAIDTFVDEMNLVALSPLFLFDIARIGPQTDASGGGWRYAAGAGLRLGLASYLNFDFGYALNPNPTSWEGRGALFAELRFLDILF